MIGSNSAPLSVTHLLYAARPFPEKRALSVVQLNEGPCWLCGLEIVQGVPCREVIRPSFTNLDLALLPESAGRGAEKDYGEVKRWYHCPGCLAGLDEFQNNLAHNIFSEAFVTSVINVLRLCISHPRDMGNTEDARVSHLGQPRQVRSTDWMLTF